jgi:hypothetical protein
MLAKAKKQSLKRSYDDPSLLTQLKVERKPHDALVVMETTHTASTTLQPLPMKEKTSTSDSKAYCPRVTKGTRLRRRTS